MYRDTIYFDLTQTPNTLLKQFNLNVTVKDLIHYFKSLPKSPQKGGQVLEVVAIHVLRSGFTYTFCVAAAATPAAGPAGGVGVLVIGTIITLLWAAAVHFDQAYAPRMVGGGIINIKEEEELLELQKVLKEYIGSCNFDVLSTLIAEELYNNPELKEGKLSGQTVLKLAVQLRLLMDSSLVEMYAKDPEVAMSKLNKEFGIKKRNSVTGTVNRRHSAAHSTSRRRHTVKASRRN